MKPDADYDWLEEIEGEKCLDFARAHNKASTAGIDESDEMYKQVLKILDSKEKIPYIRKRTGGLYYNFWQDDKHLRGIWRKCTWESYLTDSPDWETVIDVDALNKEEGTSWVWHGATVRQPEQDLALVKLSDGGKDADVVREFNMLTGKFVPESEGGFVLKEAKNRAMWKDENTLFVGAEFPNETDSWTDSGYPRFVKEWKRGTKLEDATTLFEAEKTDVSCSGSRDIWVKDDGSRLVYDWIGRGPAFFKQDYYLSIEKEDGSTFYKKMALPDDVDLDGWYEWSMITLRTDWKGHAAGTLLVTKTEHLKNADSQDEVTDLQVLFSPSERISLEYTCSTKNYVVLGLLNNVRSATAICSVDNNDVWKVTYPNSSQENKNSIADMSVSAVDTDTCDDVWVIVNSYLMPTTLFRATIDDLLAGEYGQKLKSLPAFFNPEGLTVDQKFAVSLDGTEIPYFVVSPEKKDPNSPVLLYGYGGFEISETPGYSPVLGKVWLEKGGTHVVANIRGGGEFGPKWHKAALKGKRHKAYEDFEAVAEDLIKNQIATKNTLACMGGSNGGLLTGNMLVRPKSNDLFQAIVCACPLLDMKRFHTLLAGASWMAEYGNPDTSDWDDFMHTFSPFHLIKQDAVYPNILVVTSTKDDRVHPGHARKMVARLEDACPNTNVLYYENIEGGHSGAADNKQSAFLKTVEYKFLWDQLGKASKL